MPEEPSSRAELGAQEAEKLDAFGGINISHVRAEIARILSLIGRDGIFAEYTLHDISHIDEMLKLLDWLIPESTWSLMTPADHLLLTLSIYLHDLGMLVTPAEFESRDKELLAQFAEGLFDGDGEDYAARLGALDEDKRERFIYQEFVRAHHGERIAAWISGRTPRYLGNVEATAAEVAKLLDPLPQAFRDDLAIVCESHHLSDLHDVTKYRVSRPYGADHREVANVQYAALMLRTADLLHIRSNRTPSTMFRLIAPTDPLSQQEWAKQLAVTAVRAKPGIDADGNVDMKVPRDTVEVFAKFSEEAGFFGLTAYLAYAGRQLGQSYEWGTDAQRRHGSNFEFPWRRIDESQIETDGFLRETFEFTFDQERVLNLLTGHTLYNNTNVVLRELIQNSLDATRLQALETAEPGWKGSIEVRWDSNLRRLLVLDNGVGMTQDVIVRNLLKVGASRYQEPEFRERYPDFSPISRFGIGVLSAFMISDAVEITTCHASDAVVRRLSLRSVHGRYLVRLLDHDADQITRSIGEHGTCFQLDLRPSANIGEIEAILHYWIAFPGCDVTLTIDGGTPIKIGSSSPAEALRNWLNDGGFTNVEPESSPEAIPAEDSTIRVVEVTGDGLDLAFAVSWSNRFREWSFVTANHLAPDFARQALGISVEGVRVEAASPGYDQFTVAAIANTRGQDAPKTDVARSMLERNDARTRLIGLIYDAYADFIAKEVERLVADRGFSLTWAAQEARYLIGPINNPSASDSEQLAAAISRVPMFVVDDGRQRRLSSTSELDQVPRFWTVHSAFFSSAEALLREVSTTVSIAALSDTLVSGYELPQEPILAGAFPRTPLAHAVFGSKEVREMRIRRENRRVDLAWETASADALWLDLRPDLTNRPDLQQAIQHVQQQVVVVQGVPAVRQVVQSEILVGLPGIVVDGRDHDTAVRIGSALFVLPTSPVAEFAAATMRSMHAQVDVDPIPSQAYLYSMVSVILQLFPQDGPTNKPDLLAFLEQQSAIQSWSARVGADDVLWQLSDLATAASTEPVRIFDPTAWQRAGAI